MLLSPARLTSHAVPISESDLKAKVNIARSAPIYLLKLRAVSFTYLYSICLCARRLLTGPPKSLFIASTVMMADEFVEEVLNTWGFSRFIPEFRGMKILNTLQFC